MSCMRMTECIELDVCIYVTKKDDCYVHKSGWKRNTTSKTFGET